ncbi:MAG: hypothetical protein USCGTAYLOR_01916 [Chromatiales bacterium USCg_Taylor]|nr:MAG: hypothetical protein USCGTAYLOR_01916 [Chromatiales bacterium USCg_Taylor]
MVRSNVFLSGWEYNRLLQRDVTTPVQSALPGRVLWTGALHFWLFDKVFCTKESLEGEILAYNTLGWATGLIFAELADLGWLVPVDWAEWAKTRPAFAKELRATHVTLEDQHGLQIRTLLANGRWEELDRIKADLLQPILAERDCFLDIGPNSLERWFADSGASASPVAQAVADAIAEPLRHEPNTLTVCEAPGEGLPDHVMATQRAVELEYEKPMIPPLLAGDLPIEEYHAKLRNHDKAYMPVNEKLIRGWRENRANLKDLRAYAKETIWPKLHNDWLPRAERDPSFLPQLRKLVQRAVRRAKFPFIDRSTDWGVRIVSGIAGGAAGIGLNAAGVQVHPDITPLVPAITALLAEAPGELMVSAIKRRRAASEELRLFYQRALRVRTGV